MANSLTSRSRSFVFRVINDDQTLSKTSVRFFKSQFEGLQLFIKVGNYTFFQLNLNPFLSSIVQFLLSLLRLKSTK